MKLTKWLERQKMQRNHFADLINVSPSYITALCSGAAWPRREIAKKIKEVTKGKVTPNDFLDC